MHKILIMHDTIHGNAIDRVNEDTNIATKSDSF